MADTKTYTPDEVTISANGLTLEGWTSISMTPQTDKRTLTASTTGHITSVKSSNTIQEIEINMPQTAPSNLSLDTLNKIDTVWAFVVKDNNSTITLYSIAKAVITKEPTVLFDDTAGERVWGIGGGLTLGVTGGNP